MACSNSVYWQRTLVPTTSAVDATSDTRTPRFNDASRWLCVQRLRRRPPSQTERGVDFAQPASVGVASPSPKKGGGATSGRLHGFDLSNPKNRRLPTRVRDDCEQG